MSTINIIGAGITGPTAALTLAREGHSVTVYEQRPPDALYSNGLMGVLPRYWDTLTAAGADLAPYGLVNMYRDWELGTVPSPFRFIIWTDLHDAITAAAMRAGARFEYEAGRVLPQDLPGTVIDAGGITSAVRRNLPRRYIGGFIYRGISDLTTDETFTTYKIPGKIGFLDIGRTGNGRAWWAFGIRRPEPQHYGTTFTDTPPAEVDMIPVAAFREAIRATRKITVLPQAAWSVAPTLHDQSWRLITLGDANGAVRALTTSGANLAIGAGLACPVLLNKSQPMADILLHRRAYAIALGLKLTGPEIGGPLEDPEFLTNQTRLYGNGAR